MLIWKCVKSMCALLRVWGCFFKARTFNASLKQRKEVAHKLIEACQNVGFVYITHHQVSPEWLAQAFEWSEKLLDLKLGQKMLAPRPSGVTVHRGQESYKIGSEGNGEGKSRRCASVHLAVTLDSRARILSRGNPRPREDHYFSNIPW